MKLLSTWFLAAMARNSASAWASPTGAGSCIAWPRAMLAGTTASISARREATPIADSISAWSAASGPRWRAANSAGFSSSDSGRWAGWSMVRLRFRAVAVSERLEQRVVGRRIHQAVELHHVADLDLEEPAVAHRVGVGQGRVGAQRLVDLDHFAADRHEDVGRGLDRLDHAGHFALGVAAAHFGQVDVPRHPAHPAHAG